MLMKIMTYGKNCQATVKTLSLIKTSVTFEQNLKNLSAATKDELKKTYSFLLGTNENDDRVTK